MVLGSRGLISCNTLPGVLNSGSSWVGTASMVSYFGKLSPLKNRQKRHNIIKRNSLIAFSTQKGFNSPSSDFLSARGLILSHLVESADNLCKKSGPDDDFSAIVTVCRGPCTQSIYSTHGTIVWTQIICFVLFDVILYVPSTIFQLNRDGSSWVEPVLS